jgi:hypothetical protein
MPTECSPALFEFARVEGRRVMASFDGGAISSDAGALLLGQADRAIRLTERFAACFTDTRRAELVEHKVETLVMRRVFGVALGYEDLNDHDQPRRDPVLAVLAGKLTAQRTDCAPLAGKSTLNRLELSRSEPTRYHKVSHDPAAIETLFVDVFLESQRKAPARIVLDLDATDDPLHGQQEGRFFRSKRAGSFMATMTATATCRPMCSAAVTCWRRSRGGPTSTPRRGRSRRLPAPSHKSAAAGRRPAFCRAAIPASPART